MGLILPYQAVEMCPASPRSHETISSHLSYISCMSLDREQVLRAAADFLGRRPNATQDEIAAAVGVSRATLHRYFAGKPALLAALDELAIEHMREALKTARLEEDSAAEALQRLVAACEPVSPYLALLYSQTQDVDLDAALAGWADIDSEITALFQRGQRAGEFRPELTAAWLTEALYSLVAGTAWSIQTGRVAGRDFTQMIAGLLLHGVRS
jgi:TetR/AcrR family transcriptional regulator, mexCD-oprJ operon repressor